MKLGLVALMLPWLAACGGSDGGDGDSDSVAYVQFYNASANSPAVTLTLDEYAYSAVEFGDSLPRYGVSPQTLDVALLGVDAAGDELSLHEQNLDFVDGENHLLVLYGDYGDSKLMDLVYNRDELDELNDEGEDKAQVLVAHVAPGLSAYDVYVAADGVDFGSAQLLGSPSYGQYSDSLLLDTGYYRVFLTEPGGTEPVFSSALLDFSQQTVQKLMLRPGFGPDSLKLRIDAVDSTGSPLSVTDAAAAAQYRVYNACGAERTLELGKDEQVQSSLIVAAGAISEYQVLPFDDYDLDIWDEVGNQGIQDLLLTFNQDDSRTLVIYPGTDGMQAMALTEDLRPRSFDYKLTAVNLVPDSEDLSIYFLTEDETLDSAQYKLSNWDFSERPSLTLPSGSYEVLVIAADDNGTLSRLARLALNLDGHQNLSLVLTRDGDSYRLTAL
ncbi:DUF4397 domain-containing protein [Shewanella cyperi]|uniref:DUF4397 domain-containing protein n=1 Tax=Shewanella cyperi TaxID=2814292 RepID=UPI001A93D356|nr:DUF4397 domain-containing protein [Shewanella cyperi]QSX41009.1 DUF4397 domain-containing protein [Shewanella cyperi]